MSSHIFTTSPCKLTFVNWSYFVPISFKKTMKSCKPKRRLIFASEISETNLNLLGQVVQKNSDKWELTAFLLLKRDFNPKCLLFINSSHTKGVKIRLNGTTDRMLLSLCLQNLKQALEHCWTLFLHKTYSRNIILLEEVRCIVTEKGTQIHSKKKGWTCQKQRKRKWTESERQQFLATE